ncbi:hypothetical protein [Draconibacterium sediminis]|uniref:hypothetical protein n=1 Tax=Draconibacterium sediminis TaxID=1544798 RepID=UPI0026F11697|nr:hypothetical protein [Draconibacterium sediminis]
MLREQLNTNEQANLEFSIPENSTVQRILIFLKSSLIEFENEFKTAQLQIYREDDISGQLALYFQSKAYNEKLLFDFNPKVGVDFGIHISPLQLGAKPIFIVEAKRLSKSNKDYVKNPNGGIERFKREKDGFGKHLSQSGMIGYIQQESKVYWETKINRWIEELIEKDTDIVWDNEDKLIQNYTVSDFISNHQRVSEKPIKLYHFWINLN